MEIFTYHRRLATEIMFTEMYIHEDCGTPLSLLRSPKTALPPFLAPFGSGILIRQKDQSDTFT